MKDYGSDIANEQYYPATVIIDDGSTLCMLEEEKNKYYDMIKKCPIICDNLIVQMSLKKRYEVVSFNGLVAFNDKFGGFSTYGVIDIIKKNIELYISLGNDDRYKLYRLSFEDINKGKVK